MRWRHQQPSSASARKHLAPYCRRGIKRCNVQAAQPALTTKNFLFQLLRQISCLFNAAHLKVVAHDHYVIVDRVILPAKWVSLINEASHSSCRLQRALPLLSPARGVVGVPALYHARLAHFSPMTHWFEKMLYSSSFSPLRGDGTPKTAFHRRPDGGDTDVFIDYAGGHVAHRLSKRW